MTIIESRPSSRRPQAPPQARYDAGRSRREDLPLEAHAELVMDGRPDPLAILAAQDTTRVKDLVPIRYGRMSRSPFTFLRGAAAVMASDLASTPTTDLGVELCGDAHLGNFRTYRAPSRELVFDLNDFDETLPGPFEWDVKRLATSITVAGRNNGFSTEKTRAATREAMRSYRIAMGEAAGLNPLDLSYYRFDATRVLERMQTRGKKHAKRARKRLGKAQRKDSLRALRKYTDVVDGRRVIVPDPPVIVPVPPEHGMDAPDGVVALFDRYVETLPLDRQAVIGRFTPIDVAQKVVGVGSVGTRCLILLLEAGDGTPLFLQFKQAVSSVLEAHLEPSPYEQAGRRVVEGQRLIQATSDLFLGWARYETASAPAVDFYFRQLWDGKGKSDPELMTPPWLTAFSDLCGKTLAYAHARSGDPMMIHGYIDDPDGGFEDAMVAFADRYADLTDADHATMAHAIEDGRLEVIRDT